jgi:hypothetical protein
VQAVDFDHTAVFEGVEKGVGYGSHGNHVFQGERGNDSSKPRA